MSLKWLKGLDLFKVCLVLMVLKCKMCFDVLKWPCLDGAPLWWGGHFSLPTHLATRPLLSKVLKLDHCCQKYWDLFTIVKIIETLPLLINLICCITVALVVVLQSSRRYGKVVFYISYISYSSHSSYSGGVTGSQLTF